MVPVMARRKKDSDEFDLAVVLDRTPDGRVVMRRHSGGRWQPERVEKASAVARRIHALTDVQRAQLQQLGIEALPGEASRGR